MIDRSRSVFDQLSEMVARVHCALCGQPIGGQLDYDAQRRSFTLYVHHHGAVERRLMSEHELRSGGLERFLAPAFERAAYLRKRKDPAMLQFRRKRLSGKRPL